MINTFIKKIETSGWKYEEVFDEEKGIKRIEFYVPKEREHEKLSITGNNSYLGRFINSEFFSYRYIKGFEGIWSHMQGKVECELTFNTLHQFAGLKALEQFIKVRDGETVLDQEECSDEIEDGDIRLEQETNSSRKIVFRDNNIVVSIGKCSLEFALFASRKSMIFDVERFMNRVFTLQIEGISIDSHDKAFNYLLKVSNSLFFQLNELFNYPMILNSERPNRRDRSRNSLPDKLSIDVPVLKYEYDNEPMSIYLYGKNSSDLPLFQYLSIYQSIEYYFPVYSNLDAKQKIKRLLKDPNFDPNNDSHITKLVSSIKVTRSGEVIDERGQFKATVKGCLEENDLRDFIYSDIGRKEYYEKNLGKKLSPCQINVKTKSNDIINEICERLYDIRNRIVHKKVTGQEGDIILPYSSEVQHIKYDIQLLEYIARNVLIDNSRALIF
ncbi:hypothetical protein SAMN05661091_1622 [Paenibacillus uliginis N3/975]|uniref:Apea-like HEPN domain-containing protein n=1 Tax=Paenibacillus uliginis N3/975 TaxID=1313296 RepID=A0A1X7H2Y1_9BACL|nr:hypothetical protein [Paenibacillus uliginis]SMF78862.1 hypothetical protein SAMN05661091_1622 [Paenibacillus uliginis N3/975]